MISDSFKRILVIAAKYLCGSSQSLSVKKFFSLETCADSLLTFKVAANIEDIKKILKIIEIMPEIFHFWVSSMACISCSEENLQLLPSYWKLFATKNKKKNRKR